MSRPAQAPESIELRPAGTFFGAPLADLDELGPGNIAAVGVYCDHFSAGRPGGRFGARQFRYVTTVSPVPVPPTLVDLGDMNVFPLEPDRTCEILTDQTQRILARGAKLFAIGGDYSVSPAILRGIAKAKGRSLGVVRISRRLDLHPAATGATNGPWRHGATNEIASILAEGLSAIALLGGRGAVPAEEMDRLADANVVSATQMGSAPAAAGHAARNIVEPLADAFYLSIDADVLAPQFGATALRGAYGGLSITQLVDLIAAFRGMRFVGAELTGHVPDLDVPGRAATAQFVPVAAGMLECLAVET